MKNLFKTLAVILIALLFTACNNTASDQNVNDSTAVATEQATPAEPVLAEEGLPPVVIGAKINDLPEAVDGLYASKEYHQIDPNLDEEEIPWDEVEGWYFYDKDGNLLFTAEDNEGTIFRITVRSSAIKTSQGAYVGMTRDELAAIEGAKYIAPNPEADYQIHTFELGKISITMDWENKAVTDMNVHDYSAFE